MLIWGPRGSSSAEALMFRIKHQNARLKSLSCSPHGEWNGMIANQRRCKRCLGQRCCWRWWAADPSTLGLPRPYSLPPMYVSVNQVVKLEPFL